jgi:DNA-binding transcriptional LysR family regulator
MQARREGDGATGSDPLEMHQVRYFLAVARHLNFTRAAEEVRVAQPALTRAIQKLEFEFQGPLFRRERANTHLTELGRMMLPHLQAAHSAAETARHQARTLRMQNIGSLSLGVSTDAESRGLSELLLQVASEMSEVEFSVKALPTREVERGLMAGEFDAALLGPMMEGNERFDLYLVHDDQLVVAFGKPHRYMSQTVVPLEALDGEPLVERMGCPVEDAVAAAMNARGVCRNVRHRCNDLGWMATFVRQGQGCAILPKSRAVFHGLPFKPLDGLPLSYRTALATVSGRRYSRALGWLVQQVKAEAGSTCAQAISGRAGR